MLLHILKISLKRFSKLIQRKDWLLPNYFLIHFSLKIIVDKAEDSMNKMRVLKRLSNNFWLKKRIVRNKMIVSKMNQLLIWLLNKFKLQIKIKPMLSKFNQLHLRFLKLFIWKNVQINYIVKVHLTLLIDFASDIMF